jgi:hypothetical protein
VEDAACIKEHVKGMAMMKFMTIIKSCEGAISGIGKTINDADGSSDIETCFTKLNDNTSLSK